MLIRQATKKDLKQCERLGKIPEFELPSGGYMKAQWLESYLDPDFFMIAEEKDRVIGYFLGEKLIGGVGLLWYIMVHKDFRGKGFGTKLLNEFERRVKKRGIDWIVLYGPALNKKTIRFYEKHGYNKGKTFYEFNKVL